MSNHGSRTAADAYAAAFAHLNTMIGPEWVATDWNDRSLQWRFLRPVTASSPQQGWKIHVSASAAESASLLMAVAGELARLELPFKLPRRIADVVFLNSGDAGSEQLGKIITIYPGHNEQARDAIECIDRIWPVSQGPEVQTDLHLRPRSAVSFRYGVFRAGPAVVSSTGIHEYALRGTDGVYEADLRRLNGEQPRHAPHPPFAGVPPVPHPIRLHEPMLIGNAEYMALMQLSDTSRARTFLAVDLGTLDTVVMKVGRYGVAGDVAGYDIRDLLRREFEMLRLLEEQEGIAPRALQWQDGVWPMLVMQDFRGRLMCELPRRERIAALPLLAQTVVAMHDAGFVHGDIKLENSVRREDGVGLIDFEMAARTGEQMRTGGTRGHLGPEVVSEGYVANGARDVFALAGCVVQAVLDVPPGLLPAGAGRVRAILANEGASDIARLVASWMAPAPAARPTARAVCKALRTRIDTWRDIAPAQGRPSCNAEYRWQRRASSDAAQLTSAFVRTSGDSACWRNEHFMRGFECEAINIGAAGILLGLVSIDCALQRSDHGDVVDQGARWLASRPAAGNGAGLFTGNAGVAIALAVAGRRLGNPAYLAAARLRFEASAADGREIDLFSGAAGVVWAACILREIVQEEWPLWMVRDAVEQLGRHVGVVAQLPVSTSDADREVPYLGCAHGSAGIAMALACWGHALGKHACIDTARDTFRQIAHHGRTADGSALRIGSHDARHHAVGNWCHGVAGYLWALLNGLGDDPTLRAEIDWAVGLLQDSMSVGTPTYCHGLAGQLELWHLIEGIPRFSALARARAGKVARALRALHIKVDGRCAWPSDDPDIVTPDLWIGFLGPATALALHAGGIRHPLLSPHWLATCAQHRASPSPPSRPRLAPAPVLEAWPT